MRRIRAFAVLISAFAFASGAWAEQVIHFTNGTSLPVSSYRIEGDMVHVDLGGNAMMAFPKALIESFETTDQVRIAPSSPKPGGSGRMIASSSKDAGAGRAESRLPDVQVYNNASADPAAAAPAARAAYGGRQVQNAVGGWGGAVDNTGQGGNLRGSTRVGGHYVIDSGTGGGIAGTKKRVGAEAVAPDPPVVLEPPVEEAPPPEPEYPPPPPDPQH